MNEKKKSFFNMAKVVTFIIKRAFRTQKSILVFIIIIAVLDLIATLVNLLVSPVIIGCLENETSLEVLLYAIGIFTGTIVIVQGSKRYVDAITFSGRVTFRQRLLNDINRKSMTMSFPDFISEHNRNLLSRACQTCYDNSLPGEHVWKTVSELISSATGFIIYLYFISGLKLSLALIVGLTAVLSYLIQRRTSLITHGMNEPIGDMNKKLEYVGSVMESPEYAKDIRIFGLSSWIREVKSKTVKAFAAIVERRHDVIRNAAILDALLAFLRNGIAYIYLIGSALKGEFTAAEFILYFTAFSGFSNWIVGILNGFSSLRDECVELSSVMEYLDIPDSFQFDQGIVPEMGKAHEIRLENVSFKYPGSEKWIIRDMNLTIHEGEKLAVVGLNGAGKSTIVKLITGIYDPTVGRVLLDGTDVKALDRRKYYDLFSTVFQDYMVMPFTIKEAVSNEFGEQSDIERVKEAIDKAGMREVVESLPEKYETHLGKEVFLDGMNLSGGQAQRLMLARALYKNGDMLVLDEPTAALDPLAESDIYQRYSIMTEGKTSIFISHRLASTRFCDRILFLEHGKITEEGTHDELLAMKRGYADLFDVQARYYREGEAF